MPREMLLSIRKELIEKHKIRRRAVKLGSVSVLVDMPYYIGIVRW